MSAISSLCIKPFGNAISLKLIEYFEKWQKNGTSTPPSLKFSQILPKNDKDMRISPLVSS